MPPSGQMIVTVCLTNFTHVINQNYFLKETVWGEVHHTGHCPEQGVKFLIIKTYDDAGGGEIGWVVFLMTSARKTGRELVIPNLTCGALSNASPHSGFR